MKTRKQREQAELDSLVEKCNEYARKMKQYPVGSSGYDPADEMQWRHYKTEVDKRLENQKVSFGEWLFSDKMEKVMDHITYWFLGGITAILGILIIWNSIDSDSFRRVFSFMWQIR